MKMLSRLPLRLTLAVLTFGIGASCSGPAGDQGPAGKSAAGGGSGCTVVSEDGGVVVKCGDASVTVPNGSNGSNGTNGADGSNGTNGADGSTGPNGSNGLNAGQTPGLALTLGASSPASGGFFAAGEKIVVTGTFKDKAGNPLAKSDLKTANLYMNGPHQLLKDKTAVGLLGASTDRSKAPHHYIDLLTDTNAVWSGNTVTYTLNAITNEDPGTYTIGVWTVVAAYPLDQTFELTDVQILSATVDPEIVGVDKADGTGSCMDCHKGAASGMTYLHHIDPGYSPTGNPSLDSVPVRTCLMCHNQDGYAAIQVCADNTKPIAGKCADSSTPTYLVDPIVRRVHGVHMGEHLLSKLDTNATTGDFKDYLGLGFPANIKNCTKCHNDDAWKTQSNRQACGACHDQVEWTTGNFVPSRPTTLACTADTDCASLPSSESPHCNTTSKLCELTQHGGGAQNDDSACAMCHGAGKTADVAKMHKIDPPAFKYTVNISLTAPANGTDYEGNEAPVVTVTLKDAASGAAIDPNTLTQANKDTVELFVSGPRKDTMPVLTTAAANPGPSSYYVFNDLRVQTSAATEDPKLTRSATGYSYQLAPVTGLQPGSYTVLFIVGKFGVLPQSWAIKNFNVGQAKDEPMVATNCTNCHADSRMHEGYFAVTFTPDICKNCHDYQAQNAKNTAGWGVFNANFGFGAAPFKRRVHGVHFGHYLNHPEQVHQTADEYNETIFPQDVRNCTTCHSTSDSWKQEPSRVACMACHDSDASQAHGTLMTIDPTPAAPYSGDETESCDACHGDGKQFAIATVHSISNPYKPPYAREAKPSSF